MILVSIAVKNDLCSAMVLDNGKVVESKVLRYNDWNTSKDSYKRILFILSEAIKLSRGYIEEHQSEDIVSFEVSNSTLIKWINHECANENYKEEFYKVFEELNRIPMLYSFSYSKRPRAYSLLGKDCVTSEKLSGVESLVSDDLNKTPLLHSFSYSDEPRVHLSPDEYYDGSEESLLSEEE